MSQLIVCSHCGQLQGEAASTCSRCAAQLSHDALPPPGSAPAVPSQSDRAGFYVPALPGGRVPCPQCGHSNSPQRIRCKRCYTPLPKIEHAIPPELASSRKRYRTIATIAILGSILSVFLWMQLLAIMGIPAAVVPWLWVVSATIWIIGWCYYAKAKGYPALRGLWSIFGVLGALVLIVMRDRSQVWR